MKMKIRGEFFIICLLSAVIFLIYYEYTNPLPIFYRRNNQSANISKAIAFNARGIARKLRPYNVYIMNAYLIGDEDTRIILLTKCKYFAKLVIHSGEGSVFPVTLELLDDCPPYWLKGCCIQV
uniref:Glycosyltransferase family 92 protein n=1 Tax=Parascaris univalens TaxID=6257 RepID=A0A914ZSN5_PARUN